MNTQTIEARMIIKSSTMANEMNKDINKVKEDLGLVSRSDTVRRVNEEILRINKEERFAKVQASAQASASKRANAINEGDLPKLIELVYQNPRDIEVIDAIDENLKYHHYTRAMVDLTYHLWCIKHETAFLSDPLVSDAKEALEGYISDNIAQMPDITLVMKAIR